MEEHELPVEEHGMPVEEPEANAGETHPGIEPDNPNTEQDSPGIELESPGAEQDEEASEAAPTPEDEKLAAALKNLDGSLMSLEEALNRVAHSLESLQEARRTFSRLGWAVFLILPVTLLIQMAASVILYFAAPGWGDSWLVWAVSFFPMYAAAVPLALLALKPLPAFPPEDRPLGPWRTAGLFPSALALTYGGNAVSMLLLYLLSLAFGTSPNNPLEDIVLYDSAPLLRDFLMVIVSPAVEEYLFRKAVLDRVRVYGEKLALLVSALLFGLAHGNLSQFVYAFLLGLLLGYVYLRTGRLRYSIAVHVAVNFIGAVAAPWAVQYADTLRAGSFTPEAVGALVFSLALLLSCGGGIAILADNWRHIRFDTAQRELPRSVWFRTAFARPSMILTAVSFVIMSVITLME